MTLPALKEVALQLPEEPLASGRFPDSMSTVDEQFVCDDTGLRFVRGALWATALSALLWTLIVLVLVVAIGN
jgi:hypothetical protein